MLTLQDCIQLSELTPEEVDAIARHEHCPQIVAAELGDYLIHGPDGAPRIRQIIREEIEAAASRGDRPEMIRLKLVLKSFLERFAVAAGDPVP